MTGKEHRAEEIRLEQAIRDARAHIEWLEHCLRVLDHNEQLRVTATIAYHHARRPCQAPQPAVG